MLGAVAPDVDLVLQRGDKRRHDLLHDRVLFGLEQIGTFDVPHRRDAPAFHSLIDWRAFQSVLRSPRAVFADPYC